MADGGKVAVQGSHTYAYKIDPNTGDVAEPLSDYGEQAIYTITAHVNDAGGSSADFTWLASAHLGPWIDAGKNISTVPLATPPITQNVTEKLPPKDGALRAPGPFTVTCKPIINVGGATVTASCTIPAIAGGVDYQTMSVTWTGTPAAGDRWLLLVVDPSNGAKGAVVLQF